MVCRLNFVYKNYEIIYKNHPMNSVVFLDVCIAVFCSDECLLTFRLSLVVCGVFFRAIPWKLTELAWVWRKLTVENPPSRVKIELFSQDLPRYVS